MGQSSETKEDSRDLAVPEMAHRAMVPREGTEEWGSSHSQIFYSPHFPISNCFFFHLLSSLPCLEPVTARDQGVYSVDPALE